MASNMKTFRSRILQYFPLEALEKIKKLVYNNRINDINDKVDMMMAILDEYNIDFDELGTGTNRTAIFIDGYVFKIALDKWGVRDNEQEFTLSEELQPYVIKVYECNSIIMVCEYVVVINKEEFSEHKPQIRSILKDLSNEYLLGDIGTINKNFANWGYRDNQELVALDFAYIYRVIGDEMLCDACDIKPMLEYTPDFDKLTCPHCRKQFQFMDVRRKISKEMETRELEMSKSRAYVITNEVQDIELDEEDIEVTDYSQQDKTYKFNLGDYITYRNREEAIEMINERNRRPVEEEQEINTFIDLNYDPVEEAQQEMLDEIEIMMMKKKGYVPPHKPFIGVPNEEDEPEYDEDQLREENERLSQLINRMSNDDDDDEYDDEEEKQQNEFYVEDDDDDEIFSEASEEEMLREIENMRKHQDIIYLVGDEEESEEGSQTIQEVVTDAVIEIANDMKTTEPEEVNEIVIVKSEESEVSNVIETFEDEATTEQEVALSIKEVIKKAPGKKVAKVRLEQLKEKAADKEEAVVEPEVAMPAGVEMNIDADEDISHGVWLEPLTATEENLKMEIQRAIFRYLNEKNVNIKDELQINIGIGVKAEEEQEDSYEEEINIEIGTAEDDVDIEINGQPFQIGGLIDYDKQQEEEIQRMINMYGNVAGEDDSDGLTEEELAELYGNHQ